MRNSTGVSTRLMKFLTPPSLFLIVQNSAHRELSRHAVLEMRLAILVVRHEADRDVFSGRQLDVEVVRRTRLHAAMHRRFARRRAILFMIHCCMSASTLPRAR